MSILNVNKINPVGGGSTVTIAGIASVTNNISVGNSVTANSFHGDQIKLGDNKKILLGEGNDIEIYHTGSVDMIESKSLYLIQEAQNHIFRNLAGDEFYAKFFGNGSVELYHDNTKRIETTSSGITVSGTATATAFVPTEGQLSHCNLIMNGKAMVFQRYLPGSMVTVNAGSNFYCMDRWYGRGEGSKGVFTFHQHDIQSQGQAAHAALRVNVTTTSTPSTNDVYKVAQRIEGRNIDGLGFGTSGAKNITLSFLTKSSVTGTHGGSIMNGAQNRAYPFTYTINSADTWEQKSITIPGDTSGTWSSGTGVGLEVNFDMGTAESNYRRPAGSWYAGRAEGADGAVQLITQSGANWYATKIQLEVGSVATPFEHIPYADELARCQRYYQRQQNVTNQPFGVGNIDGSNQGQLHVKLTTTMRDKPTLETTGSAGDYGLRVRTTQTCTAVPVLPSQTASPDSVFLEIPRSGHGFTDGQACFCVAINNNAFLAFDAEL